MLSGLRNFRATVVCGSMIVCTIYLFFSPYNLLSLIQNSPFDRIINFFSPYSIYVLLLLLVYFVGITYLTTLETLINRIHKVTIMKKEISNKKNVVKQIIGLLAPYSINAINRVRDRVDFLIEENSITTGSCVDNNEKKEKALDKNELLKIILIEALWIEGRLVDKKIYDSFIKTRSDAEFRIGFALIFTPFILGVLKSLVLSNYLKFIIIISIIIISIIILVHGLYSYRKIYSMIAHYIADGELTTPILLKTFKNGGS